MIDLNEEKYTFVIQIASGEIKTEEITSAGRSL